MAVRKFALSVRSSMSVAAGLAHGSAIPEKSMRTYGGSLARARSKFCNERYLSLSGWYAPFNASCGQKVHVSGQPIIVVISRVGIGNPRRFGRGAETSENACAAPALSGIL